MGRHAAVPPALERALGFVPVAVLAALAASSLAGCAEGGAARLAAAAVVALVAWRTGRTWACIAAGMALHWLLRPI